MKGENICATKKKRVVLHKIYSRLLIKYYPHEQ